MNFNLKNEWPAENIIIDSNSRLEKSRTIPANSTFDNTSSFSSLSSNLSFKSVKIRRARSQSLDRISIKFSNSGQFSLDILENVTLNCVKIHSTLQPDINKNDFLCKPSDTNSSNDILRRKIFSQKDLDNIRKELKGRTDTVNRAFEILQKIYKQCLVQFSKKLTTMNFIEVIFKDLVCMHNFHILFQSELNKIIDNDLPLSLLFSNQVVISSLNWYKMFYQSFESRISNLIKLESQFQNVANNNNNNKIKNKKLNQVTFKNVVDKCLVDALIEKNDATDVDLHMSNFMNLQWLFCSLKDSLFHFEILLARYADCLEDKLEKSRIQDAIELFQNILQSCNMQCDYNEFIQTQTEYSFLHTTEPLGPSVRFVHKGMLYKKCKNSSHTRQRFIFLFSDQLFIVKRPLHTSSSNKFRIKQRLQLSRCDFSIIIGNTYQKRWGFSLVCDNYQSEFFVDNHEHLYIWIDKLHSTIYQARLRRKSFDNKLSKYMPSVAASIKSPEHRISLLGQEAPSLMQNLDHTCYCNGYRCSNRLNRCSTNCMCDGLLYCSQCLSHNAYLPYLNQPAAVCNECYSMLCATSTITQASLRHTEKYRRIRRDAAIKSWLVLHSTRVHRLFCVLSTEDCIIYPYEKINDKYHHYPIKLIDCLLDQQHSQSASSQSHNSQSDLCITTVKHRGTTIQIFADNFEDYIKWTSAIFECQSKLKHKK